MVISFENYDPRYYLSYFAVRVNLLSSGDAGTVGGFFDFAGDGFGDAFVEDGGDDVFGMEFLVGDEVGEGVIRCGSSVIALTEESASVTFSCTSRTARTLPSDVGLNRRAGEIRLASSAVAPFISQAKWDKNKLLAPLTIW